MRGIRARRRGMWHDAQRFSTDPPFDPTVSLKVSLYEDSVTAEELRRLAEAGPVIERVHEILRKEVVGLQDAFIVDDSQLYLYADREFWPALMKRVGEAIQRAHRGKPVSINSQRVHENWYPCSPERPRKKGKDCS